MPNASNLNRYAVAEFGSGQTLHLYTKEIYAMDLAVDILRFLESEAGADVKNTGWKQGFGLAVSVPVPIRMQNVDADLQTDGNEIVFRKLSGSTREFDALCDSIKEAFGPAGSDAVT